jgi:O-antigen ligase
MTTLLRHTGFIGKLRFLIFARYYNYIVRFGLILLCLALTLATTFLLRDVDPGSMSSTLKGFLPVLLIAGLAGLILIYTNLHWATVSLIIISTALADGLGTGTGTRVTFTFMGLYAIMGLWLVKSLVFERQLRFRPSLITIPALLFVATVIVSMIWSTLFADMRVDDILRDKLMVRVMTGMVIIISPIAALLFANLIKGKNQLVVIAGWFIITGLIFGVLRVATGRVPAPLNAAGQFPVWVTAFALGQALFNTGLKPIYRIGCVVAAGVWAFVTMGLGISWLSGWMPLAGVIAGMIFFYSRRLFAVGIVGIVILLALNFDSVQRILAAEEGESGGTRSSAYELAFDLSSNHLFLGTGPAGYHFYYISYGTYGPTVGGVNLSHNNYIDILMQTGVVGFTLWMAFWVAQGIMTWRLLRLPTHDLFLRGMKFTCVCAYPSVLLVGMLGDWLTPFPYTQTLSGIDWTIWAWMITGLTTAVYHIIRESNQAHAEDTHVLTAPV